MPSLGEMIAPRRLGSDFRWLMASSWTSNIGDGRTEFTTVSRWESLEAITRFAGADLENAVV